MHPWSNHPQYYREKEVQVLNTTLNAGECVSLIGLSGMGKSNLLGYLAYRSSTIDTEGPEYVLIDCNRIQEINPSSFFNLLRALRDTHKYRLTYLLATRQPLTEPADAEKIRELDDLFVANRMWLNPLAEADARWTLHRYEERHNCSFDDSANEALLNLSGHHPGLLVSLATAWPEGNLEQPSSWLGHSRVARECDLLA